MTILLLKIFLAPVIIAMCTLVSKRYGHSAGGIIVGLPLTSGPVAFILALQNGKEFVAEFSNGIMSGAALVAAFSFTYAVCSKKNSWIISILCAWSVYLIAAFALRLVNFSIVFSFFAVSILIFLLLKVFPGYGEVQVRQTASKWDIPVRAIVAVCMIFILTQISNYLGSHLTGLISTFPVYASIFAVSAHYYNGSNAGIKLLRGIMIGAFSFLLFFLTLGTTLTHYGIAFSFSLATIISVLLQLFFQWLKIFSKKTNQNAVV